MFRIIFFRTAAKKVDNNKKNQQRFIREFHFFLLRVSLKKSVKQKNIKAKLYDRTIDNSNCEQKLGHIEEDAARSVRPQGVKNGDKRFFLRFYKK
jgi:hypothetical protein